jgi:hypothetical protein
MTEKDLFNETINEDKDDDGVHDGMCCIDCSMENKEEGAVLKRDNIELKSLFIYPSWMNQHVTIPRFFS